MTEAEQAYLLAVQERLRLRGSTLLAADQQVRELLMQAKVQIVATLAAQPTEFEQWRLPQVLAQVQALLDGVANQAATVVDVGLREMWQQGEDIIDKPLAASGLPGLQVEHRLPLLDATVLKAQRQFAASRIRNVSAEALIKIDRTLGQAVLGVMGPMEAVQAVAQQLENGSTQRALTIVNTEMSRAFAVAQEQRSRQAAPLLADSGMTLEKLWRRSGKLHSRVTHDRIDGTKVAVGETFQVPNPGGGIDKMQHPHDPTAPVEQVINCGCLVLTRVVGWPTETPGAKPYSAQEIKHNPAKASAALAQAKQRARSA